MPSTDAVTADTDSASDPAKLSLSLLLSQLVTDGAAKPTPAITDPVPATPSTPQDPENEEDPIAKSSAEQESGNQVENQTHGVTENPFALRNLINPAMVHFARAGSPRSASREPSIPAQPRENSASTGTSNPIINSASSSSAFPPPANLPQLSQIPKEPANGHTQPVLQEDNHLSTSALTSGAGIMPPHANRQAKLRRSAPPHTPGDMHERHTGGRDEGRRHLSSDPSVFSSCPAWEHYENQPIPALRNRDWMTALGQAGQAAAMDLQAESIEDTEGGISQDDLPG
ncbi:hypothetical protein NW759_009695 [Fusarium solani]|nr:hypothetical protein NW759_009695 [Fusarium solani]